MVLAIVIGSVTNHYWITGRTGTTIESVRRHFTGEEVIVITSHLSDTSKAAVRGADSHSRVWLFALLPALISLVIPAAAWGDVYKWTDAKGKAVFSDVLPKPGEKVQNFEVVAKEARRETKVP